MGAIITRREYSNEFRPEKTSWLLGNVGDRITLEIDIEIEVSFNSSFSNPMESNGTEQLTRLTGSFLDDGFFIGSNISWNYGGTTGDGGCYGFNTNNDARRINYGNVSNCGDISF